MNELADWDDHVCSSTDGDAEQNPQSNRDPSAIHPQEKSRKPEKEKLNLDEGFHPLVGIFAVGLTVRVSPILRHAEKSACPSINLRYS
jgi:hypothetical protein